VAAVGIIGVGGYVYYHLSSASANDDNPSDKKVAKSPKRKIRHMKYDSEYQLPEELVHSHGNEDVKYPEDAKSPLRRQNDDYSFAYEDGRRRTVEKKENKKKKEGEKNEHEKTEDSEDEPAGEQMATLQRVISKAPKLEEIDASNDAQLGKKGDQNLQQNANDDEYTKEWKKYQRRKKIIESWPRWRYRDGILTVFVHRAIDLDKMDIFGESDPFVKLRLGKQKKQTKVVKKNKDPQWNQEFQFEVQDAIKEYLVVKVRDKDIGKKDDSIGKDFRILITDIIAENGELNNYMFKLVGTDRDSKLIMSLRYVEH